MTFQSRNMHCHIETNRIYQNTGAVRVKPFISRFGIFKIILTLSASLYTGAMISKTCAAFLEENDIFVPEDD